MSLELKIILSLKRSDFGETETRVFPLHSFDALIFLWDISFRQKSLNTEWVVPRTKNRIKVNMRLPGPCRSSLGQEFPLASVILKDHHKHLAVAYDWWVGRG